MKSYLGDLNQSHLKWELTGSMEYYGTHGAGDFNEFSDSFEYPKNIFVKARHKK